MQSKWLIRDYREGDEEQIFELVEAVQGERVPEKEHWLKGWKWMFVDNPDSAFIIWLAEHDGKMVGVYPAIIETMKVEDKVIKGAQLVDTMTHPHYRRHGICSTLGKKALSEIENGKARLAYCFPTQQVYPLHMKSGWLDISPLQVMIKPLNLYSLLEKYLTRKRLLLRIFIIAGKLATKIVFRSKKPPRVNGLAVSQISYFDDRFDAFWQKVSNDYNIIVVRDKKYLNWRYIDVPNAKYMVYVAEKDEEIYGYVVLGYDKTKELTFGYIYDIIAPSDREDVIQCLISKSVERFEEQKVDVIFSQMVPNKIYRKALLKNGFIPYFRSKSRFIAYNASPNLSQSFIKNPKNWFIQKGDLPMVY